MARGSVLSPPVSMKPSEYSEVPGGWFCCSTKMWDDYYLGKRGGGLKKVSELFSFLQWKDSH